MGEPIARFAPLTGTTVDGKLSLFISRICGDGNESAIDLFVFFASFASVVPESNGRTQAGNIAEIHDLLLQSAQPFLCRLHS